MSTDPDVERILALARQACAPVLFLLARPRQPPTGEHILGLPVRRKMFEVIRQKPGLTLGELRERVRLGWGNGYHHLKKLERAGLIRTTRIGRRLVITPVNGEMDEREAKARAHLKGQAAAAICGDISRHPGTDAASIAARTGQTVRSVYYHVKPLTALGLVVSRSRTRQFALHTTPLYERIVGRGAK